MVTPMGLVVLTDRRLAAGPLIEVVAAAVRGGAGWVVLRDRDLPYAQRRRLAVELRDLLPPGRLIVAGPDPLGADAVHLASADPMPAPGLSLVGRSCHGVPDLSDADYVTLSPIYPTATKPGYGPALGPAGAAALAGGVPWLALGGIDSPSRAAACATAGASGIAVLGAVLRSPDPEATARALATAFGAARSALATARPAPAVVAAGAVGMLRPAAPGDGVGVRW
ncbi:thiamine phosphate synthase [Paractinoplanes rishiriensis]|uniref:Thiamine phosphate synthase/TenI domain-containing protein n=1 Tax=Paractinoplanes rishiriensis TaxID=1050105 RepID=A0A919JZ04_9ACTN|nr:thiamine phosphate synthase [Actinoplanes rishiriensis]GIE96085.1 hypothetical protein Ari01nite_35500 [Actinoplanes rishiriensis]